MILEVYPKAPCYYISVKVLIQIKHRLKYKILHGYYRLDITLKRNLLDMQKYQLYIILPKITKQKSLHYTTFQLNFSFPLFYCIVGVCMPMLGKIHYCKTFFDLLSIYCKSFSFRVHPTNKTDFTLKPLWVSLSGVDFSHFDTPPDGDALPSHSLGLSIYIPSATMPFNSSPSDHLNLSRSFFGMVTKYLEYTLPLYSLPFCFCSFIYPKCKSSIYTFRHIKKGKVYILFSVYYLVSGMEDKEKTKLEKLRKMRAFAIIAKGDMPKVVNGTTWIMPSQNNPDRTYNVWNEHGEWHCTCPDHQETGLMCKHIQAVSLFNKMQDGDDDILTLKAEISHPQCPECGSYHVVKKGLRKTKQGTRQRYICKDCDHRFVLEPIKYRKGNTKLIALCMDLYFKGLSLRKISDTIEQFYNLKLHHDTIRVWINIFMQKINEYVSKYNPDLGETWNIDEQKVKTEGDWVYSWNILDEKTRFLIANTTTKQRSLLETEKVFHKAKGDVEGKPSMIITDKMNAYPYVIRQEFPEAVHIQAGIRDPINNNKVERFHGTWRERDKVMRGMQNDETAEQMLNNYKTYYNFVRKHSALDNKTPSEMAGIDLGIENEKNRWVGLISKAVCPANPTGGKNVP